MTKNGTTFWCVRNGPERPILLRFRQTPDARLRCVGRPRCLGDRGGIRVWTDITSQLNARPAGRCERCGCPLLAAEFVAHRCPSVVEPMCCKQGSDDIDAEQRKHRKEQMAFDPLAQLVPDRAQPVFGLERPECGFQISQSPVSKYEPYPQRSTPCDWCTRHTGPLGNRAFQTPHCAFRSRRWPCHPGPSFFEKVRKMG